MKSLADIDINEAEQYHSEIIAALPPVFNEFAKIVSLKSIFSIIDNFGGTRIYIPKKGSGSKLEGAVGKEAVIVLSRIYGGDYLNVPMSSSIIKLIRNREIQSLSRQGQTARELARGFGMTERSIYFICQKPH